MIFCASCDSVFFAAVDDFVNLDMLVQKDTMNSCQPYFFLLHDPNLYSLIARTTKRATKAVKKAAGSKKIAKKATKKRAGAKKAGKKTKRATKKAKK